MLQNLTDIKRRPVEEVVGKLNSESDHESKDAGLKLCRQAASFGLNMRDYLTLAIDTRAGDGRYAELNGLEAALAHLNLPFRNDFENGVVLQAASETFQKFPGARALFPEVVDNIVKWQGRQDQIESVTPLLASSRTISGTELVSIVVPDQSDAEKTYTVSEAGRFSVDSIRMGETAVKMWKHGKGYRTTYEFNRRASLDLLVPYANRIARTLELSKLAAATNILVNGDTVNAAAPVVYQKDISPWYDSTVGVAGKLQYKPFVKWLLDRAKAGVPVDTITGDYDAFLQFIFLFLPTLSSNSAIGVLGDRGLTPKVSGFTIPGFTNATLNFVINSAVPSGKIIGLTKGETLEEVIEAGSQISESEASILNQTVTYIRSENTGYKLAFGDTRSIYDFATTA